MAILLENKFDEAKAAHPRHKKALEQLEHAPLEKPAKYIAWLIKQLARHEPLEELLATLASFEKNIQRLQEKDINAYATLGDLRGAIESLGASGRAVREKAKEGAEKIYENDRAYVYYIPTKEAAQYYGKGTKWCIAATQSNNYFGDYNQSYVFLFVLVKQPKGNKYDKVALQYNRHNRKLAGFWTTDDTNQGNSISRTLLLQAVLDVSRPELFNLLRAINASIASICKDESDDAAAEIRMMPERDLYRIPIAKAIEYAKEIVDLIKENGTHERYVQAASESMARLADVFAEDPSFDVAIKYLLDQADPQPVLWFALKVDALDIEDFEDYFIKHPGTAADSFFKRIPGVDVERYKTLLAATKKSDTIPQGMKYLLQALSKNSYEITPALIDHVLTLAGDKLVSCLRALCKRKDINTNLAINTLIKLALKERKDDIINNAYGNILAKSQLLMSDQQLVFQLLDNQYVPRLWFTVKPNDDPADLIEAMSSENYEVWLTHMTSDQYFSASVPAYFWWPAGKEMSQGFRQLALDVCSVAAKNKIVLSLHAFIDNLKTVAHRTAINAPTVQAFFRAFDGCVWEWNGNGYFSKYDRAFVKVLLTEEVNAMPKSVRQIFKQRFDRDDVVV